MPDRILRAMEDVRVGRVLRAVRVRRRLRQEDVAAAADVSRQTISRLECGDLTGTPIGTLRRVCAALGITVEVNLRGPGGDLDRLLDAGHAAMHEEVARQLAGVSDWLQVPEVTFAVYGERGSIDILAWHAPTRSLLVIELKTELTDLQETVSTLDRKVRLASRVARERGWNPTTVSSWLLIADSRTNRRRVAAHRSFLGSRFQADGHAVRRWLRAPVGSIAALSFLAPAASTGTRRQLAPVRRVRRAAPRATSAST